MIIILILICICLIYVYHINHHNTWSLATLCLPAFSRCLSRSFQIMCVGCYDVVVFFGQYDANLVLFVFIQHNLALVEFVFRQYIVNLVVHVLTQCDINLPVAVLTFLFLLEPLAGGMISF